MLDELKQKATDVANDPKVKEAVDKAKVAVDKAKEYLNSEKGKEVLQTAKDKAEVAKDKLEDFVEEKTNGKGVFGFGKK